MTAPTPEQMRALAEVLSGYHSWSDVRNAAAALRAAADQLEAVQTFADQADLIWNVKPRVSVRLNAILTADTAPQEDRDE